MSRSGYTDSCDGFELIRWRGAVAAAIRGTRGQELLHGLASALDAMPDKRLIGGDLINEAGEVCALGSLGVACGRTADMAAVDPEDYEQVARFFNVAEALAREVQYENDECGPWRVETPEARWIRMRRWVQSQLLSEEPPATNAVDPHVASTGKPPTRD